MKPSENLPSGQDLSGADDRMSGPIMQLDIFPIVDFLKEHPDTRLFAEEVKSAQSAPTNDIPIVPHSSQDQGLLRLGTENDTLQVRDGPNWLAVQAHPSRFKLTDVSLAAYREVVRKKALAAAEVENPVADREYVGEFVSARKQDKREKEKETPEQQALIDCLVQALKQEAGIFLNTRKGVYFQCTHSSVLETADAAQTAGFSLQKYGNLGDKEGFGGDEMAKILSKALITAGKKDVASILKSTDKHKVGAYVVICDFVVRDIITIANKEKAIGV